MRKFLSEQTGRSMIEMLGVLAIIGVLSVGGIAGYSKAMAKYKQNKLGDQISMLITNLRTAFGNNANYANLTTETAISMGAVDKEMQNGSDAIKNVYGGAVYVNAAAGDTPYSFFITIDGLPSTACTYLASADFGSSIGAGWVSAGAQNSDFGSAQNAALEATTTEAIPDCTPAGEPQCMRTVPVPGKVSAEQGSLPITVAAAAAACTGTSNGVLLEFQ